MSKVMLELGPQQIQCLVESLSLAEKIRLARRLSLETWQARFKNLISRIDSRLKNRRTLSDDRIVRIVKKVRRRNYAQSHH